MTANTHQPPLAELHPVRPVRLGIATVGTGSSLELLAGLFSRTDFRQAFPQVCITALLLDDDTQPPAGLAHIPRYAQLAPLLEAQPLTTVLADMTEDGRHMACLRREAPPRMAVLDACTVTAFFSIITSEQLCRTCHVHLSHARTLFAALIDQIDEDILLLDAEGRITDLNKKVLERRGGAKEDWLGRYCCDLEGQDFCSTCQGACPFEETLRTGAKAEQIHTRVTPEGKVSYHRVYTYPVHDEHGTLTRVIEMRRDITGRTNMERKLHQSEKMAAIGELATYIAHEIRNPLFAIGGFANALLRSPSLDDNAREKARIILEESRRLDTILRSTMNFAKPSDPRRGDVDMNHIVRDTMGLMRLNDEKRSITTGVDLTEPLPLARGDADMTKQCLINLVKNAQEAMPRGGSLTVRTGMKQRGIFIQVEDTGTGIPEEIRENVFSPFFSTKDKGAGLGLAMTKKLIEEMGGAVELQTAEGKGTSVTLFLQPLLTVDDAPAAL
ncbi:two-component system sensor histidine kinase NtrB [Oleidesulfovibrio alaskensis]|uniref:two-component system sensor histidine kinase NtrB n=1 Tax=Oleidesulfovibrio alaskensis TaxID=58180 RepID=UPI001D2874AC|nr:ATP-binding protein [Oleidesulfovibrio alaskensis]MBG0773214.1 PAS domain-containing protein [Oleidesulfovibrio alaskensis]